MTLFPFARTLLELNLGGEDGLLGPLEITTLTSILRQLPVLEILKLERYVDGVGLFKLFQGLGQAPPGCGSQQSHVGYYGASGMQEGLSGLRKLRLFYQGTRSDSQSGVKFPSAVSLKDIKTQVLDRFRFLEKLTVRVSSKWDMPGTDETVEWQERIVSEGQTVTKCRIAFKMRSSPVVCVVV